MTLLHRCMFASLPLVIACTVQQGTTDPSAGEFDDYYSERGSTGTDGGDGSVPQVRSGVETRPAKTDKGKRIAAKKPKRKKKGKKKKGKKKKKGTKVALAGVVPTSGATGSVVEVFGSGLDAEGLRVLLGGKPQKILEAEEDHLVFRVKGKKSGKVKIVAGGAKKKGDKAKAAKKGKKGKDPRTSFVFTVVKDDGMFGRSRTLPEQGLIANVFDIGKEVSELPAFGDLGDPVGTLAVDNIDIAPGDHAQAVLGLEENFGMHFRGSLNIEKPGDYTLCLNAGDGAQLYLDEEMIVNNDGSHDTKEECQELSVEAGEYQLDLLYYQGKKGEAGLQLLWAVDGGEKEVIPATAFFPPDDLTQMARK